MWQMKPHIRQGNYRIAMGFVVKYYKNGMEIAFINLHLYTLTRIYDNKG